MNKILSILAFTAFSNSAFADTTYTCISSKLAKRVLTMTTLGSDEVNPAAVALEGFVSASEFILKKKEDVLSAKKGLNRYVGKRSLKGFAKPVQQTIFLSQNWSENSGRLLYLVAGQEIVSYEAFVCTED